MNNFTWPKPTGVSHWLEYLPGYMYCFLPSLNADEGTVQAYNYVPDFLLDFLYYAEIQKVTRDPERGEGSMSSKGVRWSKGKQISNQEKIYRKMFH